MLKSSYLRLITNKSSALILKRRFNAEGVKVPGVHEPQYLEELRPKVGFYDLINVQINGHDFAVLEKYQGYINKKMIELNFDVTRAWSSPHKELSIDLLSDRSTAVESSYTLKLYERNIQAKNVLVTKLPLLIDIIHYTLPAGVTFGLDRHSEHDEMRIYFKDSVLEKMKEELVELKNTELIGS